MGGSTGARWEWRIFSDSPIVRIARLLQKLKAANHKANSDIYIVAKDTKTNVKIRSGTLEVKAMTAVSELNAELWQPVFKTHFPMGTQAFFKVSAYVGADMPTSFGDGELPNSECLRSVEVQKRRDIFLVENAIIEYGTICIDGVTNWTFCVESCDLFQVECFIRGVHMEKEPAESYVTFLKKFLNM